MPKTKCKPNIQGIGFEWTEVPHKYYWNGIELTGVTTILGVIAKPMLIQWAANMAVDYIEKNGSSPESLKEARVAHRKTKEAAGDKGKEVHAQIEQIIKESLKYTNGRIQYSEVRLRPDMSEQLDHFLNWAEANKVRFISSEERVFSPRLYIGGTIDFVCELDGGTWIGDIKTSSAIYPEHFFQTAGYQILNEDMVESGNGGLPVNIKGHLILNLRKDGTFEEKRSISNEDNRKAFLAANDIYRIKQKLEGTII